MAVTKVETCCTKWQLGRAMARAVSRWPLTAEARVRSWVSPCGICGGHSGTVTGFSPSTSVFPCQFHSTGAQLLVKMKKADHLHHRVAQKALWLRCVCRIFCGALHKRKKKVTINYKDWVVSNNLCIIYSHGTSTVMHVGCWHCSNSECLCPPCTRLLL
jgi:hypothetical protein